jgi:two-component system LytT family response regulator
VNIDHISEIYREGHADGSVVLLGGQKVRMSKVGRQKLMELGKA